VKLFARLTTEQKTRVCQSCGVTYTKKRQSNKWFLNSKYCGNKCYYSDPNYQSKRAASISKAQKGRIVKEETKLKISISNKGKKRTSEQNKKMSEIRKGTKAWNKGIPNYEGRGENHPNWNGGYNRSERQIDMGRIDYKNWRREVFLRDNYTCVNCNKKGGNLNADHIKPYVKFPELRYDVENGRTLCVPCHYKIGWNPYKEKVNVSQTQSLR
jgi:hypothetical protein